jgi:processing peptidase subunit beta
MGILASGADANKSIEVLSRAVKAMGEGKGLDSHRNAALAENDALTLQSESLLMDHLHSIAFQTTPLAAPLTGNSKSLSAITPKALEDYMNTHVTGQRVVITAAGNVNHEDITAASMSAFGSLSESSSFDYTNLAETEYTGSCLTLRDEAVPVLTSVTALKGVSASDRDALKMRVVAKLLGNWNRSIGNSCMSSYSLPNSIIDEGDKSASYVQTFSHSYRSTGLIGAVTHSDREENEDVIYFVLKEFIRIAHEVSTTEVNRAKLKVLREALANSSSPQALAKDIGLQMLSTGQYQGTDALSAELQNVSRDQIRDFAADYFTDTDPVVVGSGPTAFFPDMNLIRGWTYQNRL